MGSWSAGHCLNLKTDSHGPLVLIAFLSAARLWYCEGPTVNVNARCATKTSRQRKTLLTLVIVLSGALLLMTLTNCAMLTKTSFSSLALQPLSEVGGARASSQSSVGGRQARQVAMSLRRA